MDIGKGRRRFSKTNIAVAFGHQANAGVLRYLRSGCKAVEAEEYASRSPRSVTSPYMRLGTHPELVEHLWDKCGAVLPERCEWVVYRQPALVHPKTGIVFAFATGVHERAFRLPEDERKEALKVITRSVFTYGDGSKRYAAEIGPEWVFGDFAAPEERWCLAAYRFAGEVPP